MLEEEQGSRKDGFGSRGKMLVRMRRHGGAQSKATLLPNLVPRTFNKPIQAGTLVM